MDFSIESLPKASPLPVSPPKEFLEESVFLSQEPAVPLSAIHAAVFSQITSSPAANVPDVLLNTVFEVSRDDETVPLCNASDEQQLEKLLGDISLSPGSGSQLYKKCLLVMQSQKKSPANTLLKSPGPKTTAAKLNCSIKVN